MPIDESSSFADTNTAAAVRQQESAIVTNYRDARLKLVICAGSGVNMLFRSDRVRDGDASMLLLLLLLLLLLHYFYISCLEGVPRSLPREEDGSHEDEQVRGLQRPLLAAWSEALRANMGLRDPVSSSRGRRKLLEIHTIDVPRPSPRVRVVRC